MDLQVELEEEYNNRSTKNAILETLRGLRGVKGVVEVE